MAGCHASPGSPRPPRDPSGRPRPQAGRRSGRERVAGVRAAEGSSGTPRRRPPATGVAVARAQAGKPSSARAQPGFQFLARTSAVPKLHGGFGAMSGDSSGRRPDGRGRARDPHRDRDRNRSRSRSPLSPGSRRGAASERREAPERPSLEDTEPSDSGDEMIDPATLEAEADQGLCRQIRHQYRALINSVQRKAVPATRRLGLGARRRSGQAAPRRSARAPISALWRAPHDLGGFWGDARGGAAAGRQPDPGRGSPASRRGPGWARRPRLCLARPCTPRTGSARPASAGELENRSGG